jgi:hypothetical protein
VIESDWDSSARETREGRGLGAERAQRSEHGRYLCDPTAARLDLGVLHVGGGVECRLAKYGAK